MTIRTAADIQQDIARLQEELDTLNARRQKMGEENWAADQLHSLTCRLNHTDQCGYSYEGDFAFDKDKSEKFRVKARYRKMKAAMENALGQPLAHQECVDLIHAVSRTF